MNHFVVHLRLTQHCKAAIPQYTIKIKFNIEQSFLDYTVGSCWSSTLKIAGCTCQLQTPNQREFYSYAGLFLLLLVPATLVP